MAKQEISFYDKGQVDDLLDDKQNILTAGENIRIQNDVISAEVPEGDTFEAGNYTGSAANGQQIVINYGEVDEQDLVTSKYYLSSGQNTDGAMTQKAITDALAVKANAADLATVATTGSYDDLTDKPIIPAGVTLYPGTGQNTDGAMTQKATTDALDLKLTKITTTGQIRVYGVSTTGDNTMLNVIEGAIQGSIPWRTTAGRLHVGTPVADSQATTKKYVDDAISAIQITITDNTTFYTITY